MFNVGGSEILVVLVLALLVLGPERLPGAARQVGKFIADFRRVTTDVQRDFRETLAQEDLLDTVRTVREAVDIRTTLRADFGANALAFSAAPPPGSASASSTDEAVLAPDGLRNEDRPPNSAHGTIIASPTSRFRDVLSDSVSAEAVDVEPVRADKVPVATTPIVNAPADPVLGDDASPA